MRLMLVDAWMTQNFVDTWDQHCRWAASPSRLNSRSETRLGSLEPRTHARDRISYISISCSSTGNTYSRGSLRISIVELCHSSYSLYSELCIQGHLDPERVLVQAQNGNWGIAWILSDMIIRWFLNRNPSERFEMDVPRFIILFYP